MLNRALLRSTAITGPFVTYIPISAATTVAEVECILDPQYTHVGIELVLTLPTAINEIESSRRVTFMGVQL